jgi:hypothetical protein
MSLYRAALRLALLLPLGVAVVRSQQAECTDGFTDVSSVFIRLSRAGATIDRTPVRKS